jgi:hypothetical protein
MKIRLFEIIAGLFRAKPKWPQHDRNWMPTTFTTQWQPFVGWVPAVEDTEPEQFIGAPSYEDGLGRETLARETKRRREPRFCIGCGTRYGYRQRVCRVCRAHEVELGGSRRKIIRDVIASDTASSFTRESGS